MTAPLTPRELAIARVTFRKTLLVLQAMYDSGLPFQRVVNPLLRQTDAELDAKLSEDLAVFLEDDYEDPLT